MLVTGRELDELLGIFPEIGRFDRVVAENGALLYDPATKAARDLAPPPPPPLLDELRRRGVPFSVGRSIVATVEPHEHAVLAAIRDLGLEWHVIFNKGSVMALPSGVTKATAWSRRWRTWGSPRSGRRRRRRRERPRLPASLRPLRRRLQRAAVVDRGRGPRHRRRPRCRRGELIDALLADDLARVVPSPDRHDRPAS